MAASFEPLRIDTSESDFGLDLLLLKKKIKRIKLAFLFMLASIVLVAVFTIILGTMLTKMKQNNERNHKSNLTENNAIEMEIRTLNKSNIRANEMEETTNKRNDEILGRIAQVSSVIPEFELDRKNSVFSLVQNLHCLDTLNGIRKKSLELFPCHDIDRNQEWQFTVDDELRNRNSCLTFSNNTSSNTAEVIFDECNGSVSQKFKFISGTLQSTEYDLCAQTEGKFIFASKCNLSIATQKFERQLSYKIDRFCTFKQGSYVLLNASKVIVATNGFLVYQTLCLTYSNNNSSLSWYKCDKNSNFEKWNYTDDGQIKNVFENVCVEKHNNDTVAVNKCNLNSESQKWICHKESI